MLELYMFDTCPYCVKVLREIDAQKRGDIVIKNIYKSDEDYNTLLSVGGKDQVPCLFIDGKPMYESDDIIAWLRKNPESK